MMCFAHWLTPDIDRHGTCGISYQYTVHDRRCIKTDFIFSSLIHSFVLYVRTCTNCSFQSCDRSTAHRKKLHGQKELTNKTSQPISFINSIDGRKQLNTWADEKGSASHLYARRGGITCFWRKNVTHFYGFIFNINNSLIFR